MSRFPHTVSGLLTRSILLGIFVLPVQAEETWESEDEHQGYFKNLTERFSYAYGADLAKNFKQEGIKVNVDLFMEAMQAVLGEGEPRMEAEEIAATIEIFRQVHVKQTAERNKQEGELFLTENAKKEGVKVTASGLQYKVITEGKGKDKPAEHDQVTVHYRGTFVDGREFDSTYARNTPYRTTPAQLIEGWSEALQMMSEGAKWELYVPAHLAYGEQGSQPYIGPNTVLVFEVELLKVEKSGLGFAQP